jgi:four helix bundle protein
VATIQRFQDIEAWQKVRELTRAVYACSSSGAFSKDFGLRDQIRRACVSIMSNIPEGFERGSKTEFLQFLSIAKGSTGEAEAQLYVALDQEYVAQEKFDRMSALVESTKKLLTGFMNYLKKTDIRGQRYK